MHSFAQHEYSRTDQVPAKATHGLILDQGWRYDLTEWCCDTFVFRGTLQALRQRTIDLACPQPGESVLDVGCGTGTVTLEIQRRMGAPGRVVGIDPGPRQIARARAKAMRHRVPVEFQIGVIERLTFPDQTFDTVLSSLMMHHLPKSLKQQGLAEIARVLKPGGRLVIADFQRPDGRRDHSGRVGAGGSNIGDLAALVQDAGFMQVETEEIRFRRPRFPALQRAVHVRLHPDGAGFIWASKGL